MAICLSMSYMSCYLLLLLSLLYYVFVLVLRICSYVGRIGDKREREKGGTQRRREVVGRFQKGFDNERHLHLSAAINIHSFSLCVCVFFRNMQEHIQNQ